VSGSLSADELVQSLAERGIRDQRVLAAVRRTPREAFVPEELRDLAWQDDALPIGLGQTISQPFMVAWMTELLELDGDETVLEIGTGSGYQTAILAQLASRVVTVERLRELSDAAQARLAALGVENVEFEVGDGTLGWPAGAPYDAILVTAGAPRLPQPLYDQLRPGGRLVIPIGDACVQTLETIHRGPGGPEVVRHGGCRFVPLLGAAGWPEPPDPNES